MQKHNGGTAASFQITNFHAINGSGLVLHSRRHLLHLHSGSLLRLRKCTKTANCDNRTQQKTQGKSANKDTFHSRLSFHPRAICRSPFSHKPSSYTERQIANVNK